MYKLKKEELVREVVKCQIEDSGTVPEIRKRLIGYIRQNPENFKDKSKDGSEYNEDLDRTQNEIKNSKELVYIIRPEDTSTPTFSSPPQEPIPGSSRNQQSILNNTKK